MQHWEYLDVVYGQGYGKYVFVNGKALDPNPADFFQYLNQIGSQGWEMVGFQVVPAGVMGHEVRTIYAFKRPKP